MTKTKIQFYLFATALFFLSVFFVGNEQVSAQSTYNECLGFGGDYSDCADYPGAPSEEPATCYNNYDTPTCCEENYGYWYNNTCNDSEQNPCANNYSTATCCEENYGYWYNNTCNANEFDWNEECKLQFGEQSWFDGTDCQDTTDPAKACVGDGGNWDGSTCVYDASCQGKFEDPVCCKENEGFWYNEICNSDEQGAGNDCSSNAPCSDGYVCDSTGTCMYDGFLDGSECGKDSDCANLYDSTFECSGIVTKTCEKIPPGAGTDCSKGSSCGDGYVCDSTGICMYDGISDGSECGNDRDCATLYGTNFECSGLITKTCERISGTIPPRVITTTTKPKTTKDGGTIPIGSDIHDDGSITDPNTGRELYPPGSVDGASSERYTGPKCGETGEFEEIGGVCFPTTTGLSDAPVFEILSNLFSWLMGLFTTFAVLAFVVSGIQYFMASGDESMAESAKDNAKNALIGIVVGLSGFIIVKAIAAALSGQSYLF